MRGVGASGAISEREAENRAYCVNRETNTTLSVPADQSTLPGVYWINCITVALTPREVYGSRRQGMMCFLAVVFFLTAIGLPRRLPTKYSDSTIPVNDISAI